VRLDAFAFAADPEESTAASPSSAHTYRLLIFKELSLRSSAFFASVIKREANYEDPPPPRQAHLKISFFGAAELSIQRRIAGRLSRRRPDYKAHRDHVSTMPCTAELSTLRLFPDAVSTVMRPRHAGVRVGV
jgi:hypothetical protein